LGCATTWYLPRAIRFSVARPGLGSRREPKDLEAAQPPEDLFTLKLDPVWDWKPEERNQWAARVTPLIGVGVRAYLAAGGRATPEDFAAVLKDDPGVATPAFAFDGLHTTQELLREGMHPRLSGLHNAPGGLIAACMPAAGIFHFADPERAYGVLMTISALASTRPAGTPTSWLLAKNSMPSACCTT
jgi:hypothetical protein